MKHPIRRARRAHRISESAGSGDGALRQTNDGAETQFGARPPNPLLREFRADRPLRSRPVDKGIARDERSPHRLEKLQSPKPAPARSGPSIPTARSLLPAPASRHSALGPRPSGLGSGVWGLGSGVWVSNLRSGPGLGLRLDLRNRLSGYQVSRRCTRPSALCSWSSTLAYRSTALAASPWSLSTDSGSEPVIHGSNPLPLRPAKANPRRPAGHPTCPDCRRLPNPTIDAGLSTPTRMSCPVGGRDRLRPVARRDAGSSSGRARVQDEALVFALASRPRGHSIATHSRASSPASGRDGSAASPNP